MTTTVRVLAGCVALTGIVAGRPAFAQLEIGTWVRKATTASQPEMTMIVEACCNGGRRLTYRLRTGNTDTLMTLETKLDGTDAPVLVAGKPSGETMAIKREDDHHASTVIKMNGTVFATSKATLSPDGKTLTAVTQNNGAPGPQGESTEIYVKQ